MMELSGKEILLGVTGGIAAYKSAEIVSRLRKKGANVHVIMTKNATEFVAPLTFETLSGNPVVSDTFMRPETWEVEHVSLAKRADLFLIAPATANILAKMASGIADDMLTTTVLATKAPVFVAPTMNTGMWTAPATKANIALLAARGVNIIGPDEGFLACGDTGPGRMSEPSVIVDSVISFLSASHDYSGLKVLVTAGATRERMDPVRFLTNDSSGKMGFAVASAAAMRGADVTLIKGITSAELPTGITILDVESTNELYNSVISLSADFDVIIQAAAPADYRFAEVSSSKIKKESGKPLIFELVENPDIAAEVGRNKKAGQTLVGFAAETDHVLENAAKKLRKKNLDMIVANDVTKPGAGFNTDTNIVSLITEDGVTELPLLSKKELGHRILDKVLELRSH